ncbi:MAG: hypothetical protein ACM3ZB_08230 [bacterium]|jgi:hypothetical protein
MTRAAIALFSALLVAGGARADLSAARSERNLEKRSALALDNARDALKAARTAYMEHGDLKATSEALQEIVESIQFSYDSLLATGKDPSRKPKHFKRAEIRTRELMRHLDDFRAQMSALDRAEIERTRDAIQKIHDALLEGIMGGGRKKK